MEQHGFGMYRKLPLQLLPTLYLAYNGALSSESGQVHAPVRQLFEKGDAKIVSGMAELAALTHTGVTALETGDLNLFGDLMVSPLVALCEGRTRGDDAWHSLRKIWMYFRWVSISCSGSFGHTVR